MTVPRRLVPLLLVVAAALGLWWAGFVRPRR